MSDRSAIASLPASAWFKSSHSQENGNSCVEVADLAHQEVVGIRDSKDVARPALCVGASGFAAFVRAVSDGTLHG
ncbi:DUF397 domain-containing protein [Streptomyces chumphonensis]|uniref:DUF397 domain-containing protein n=1 Tax=Streptomyces chumphonensis TaxID=1214925 RepID=UPI003D723052